MVKKIFVDEKENELEAFPTNEGKICIGIDSDTSGDHGGYFFGSIDLDLDDAKLLVEELKGIISFLQLKMQGVPYAEK